MPKYLFKRLHFLDVRIDHLSLDLNTHTHAIIVMTFSIFMFEKKRSQKTKINRIRFSIITELCHH